MYVKNMTLQRSNYIQYGQMYHILQHSVLRMTHWEHYKQWVYTCSAIHLVLQSHFINVAAVSTMFNISTSPSFACCGGCSSYVREDGNNKTLIPTGVQIFIWDIALKASPGQECLKTFPYDPNLDEQDGNRRIRSGQLEGTEYVLDHDYDSLCCNEGGLCRLQNEDASGKCQCIKKWGFTGDHCEYSVYDIGKSQNAILTPKFTNWSDFKLLLPDIRIRLLDYDLLQDLKTSIMSTTELQSQHIFEIFRTNNYRKFAAAPLVISAVINISFIVVCIFHILYIILCCCRRKYSRKYRRRKIYSKKDKITTGCIACGLLLITTITSFVVLYVVFYELVPSIHLFIDVISDSFVDELNAFIIQLLGPINHVLSMSPTLRSLQIKSVNELSEFDYFDSLMHGVDMLSKPIWTALDTITPWSVLYPTVNNDDCTVVGSMINFPCDSILTQKKDESVMHFGAITGCFRCKLCSTLESLLKTTKRDWIRGPFRMQKELAISRQHLQAFGQMKDTLESAMSNFSISTSNSVAVIQDLCQRIIKWLNKVILNEVVVVLTYSIITFSSAVFILLVLCFFSYATGICANRSCLSRLTCCAGELVFTLAAFFIGVLYCIIMMTQDGRQVLFAVDTNYSFAELFDEHSQTQAEHLMRHILYDQNLFSTHRELVSLVSFADKMRLHPYENPIEGTTTRVDVESLYSFQKLFEIADSFTQPDNEKLARLFGWQENIVHYEYKQLEIFVFGNDSILSPYIEQYGASNLEQIISIVDPNDDGKLVTTEDQLLIRSMFNLSWKEIDDEGAAQNELIHKQWLLVAQFYYQKTKLLKYINLIANTIQSVSPMLEDLKSKTQRFEQVVYTLKGPVEEIVDSIRESRLKDCSFNGNCAWFREHVTALHDILCRISKLAEFAFIVSSIGAFSLLLGLCFLSCFASRLHLRVVKVYVAK